MFERFTKESRAIVVSAQEEARLHKLERIGSEHLLAGLARSERGPVADVLAQHGLTAAKVDDALARVSVKPTDSIDADALRSLGIDLDQVVGSVDAQFGPGAFEDAGERPSRWPLRGSRLGRRVGSFVPFDDHARKTLELALREAIHRGDREITPAHLLFGLLRDDAPATRRMLHDLGVTPGALRTSLETGCGAAPDPPPSGCRCSPPG